MTVPAISALRQRYPQAKLLLLGKRLAADFVQGLRLVDGAIVVDKHLFDSPAVLLKPRAWKELRHLVAQIRGEHPDTAVIFHHLTTRWGAIKYALLSLASGAKRRVGLNNGRGWFLTSSAADRGFGARHEAEYWLEVAELLDATGDLRLGAPISEDDRSQAKELLEKAGNARLFAVHAGTGWYGPGRLWGGTRFAATAQKIETELGLRCVLVGTLEDAAETEPVFRALPDSINLVGRTSVGELGAVLERCEFLVDNDSGVGHLSAAVKTPVVSIFGPTHEDAWRPLLGKVVSVDLACRPSFYRGFKIGSPKGCATRDCLNLITPEMVVPVARELLTERAVDV